MLALTGWAVLGLSTLLFATRFLTSHWQPLVVAATFAYFAVPGAVLGSLLLVAGGSAGWVPGLLLAAVMATAEARPWLHRRPAGEHLLTVLTANVWCGRGDPAAVLALARDHDVDVIALQETTAEFVAGLEKAGVSALFPHAVVAAAPDWEGAGVWSRRPLRDEVVARRGTLYRVEATVRLGASESPDDPTVMSVHVHAPWPGPPGPWHEQLEELRTRFRDATRPLVVAGDFNATLDHARFRRLLQQATDAAVSARAWTTRTWPAHLPGPLLIAIDHVVVRGLSASQVTAHHIPGADHLAVIATVIRDRPGPTSSRGPRGRRTRPTP